jgi:hypothetical protein
MTEDRINHCQAQDIFFNEHTCSWKHLISSIHNFFFPNWAFLDRRSYFMVQMLYTGKPLYIRLIRATSVPYISKLKINGKNCNSSMMSWNILQTT